MKLELVISELKGAEVTGPIDREIVGIAFDSRRVKPGELFVAVKGIAADGHAFISSALESGATAVVSEEAPLSGYRGVTWLRVSDSRRALALMASAYHGHPSRELHLVGITGTNGKTTIATLLHRVHTGLGYRTGLLSTIQVMVGEEPYPATHTTPDPLQINQYLRKMVDAGCGFCFMEVSSHAIDQKRVEGLQFRGGAFTNLTREHLDYHGDFKSYRDVKKRFFDSLLPDAFALVNADDKNGMVMLQNCRAVKHTYSLRTMSPFMGKINEMHLEGSSLEINGQEVWVRLPGRFNAANLLCTYGISVLLGQRQGDVLEEISRVEPVRGRFETWQSSRGITGIVDYAHTPDALANVLETIREVSLQGGEVITVVGAGGDRDRGKRPMMARIAVEASHKVILTSDNPRSEDPEKILDDMMEGVTEGNRNRVLRVTDRAEAIRTACMLAGERDIILLAGKGHEETQVIGDRKIAFNDMEILQEHLN